MPTIADLIYVWLDGNRLSASAELGDGSDDRQGVAWTPMESKRQKELPGRAMSSRTLTLANYDVPTMNILDSYTDADELAYIETITPAAGARSFIYRCRIQTNQHEGREGVIDTRAMTIRGSVGGIQTLGKNLYAYSTDITGAVNGSAVTFSALSATQSLLVMQHVESVSGTGNLDAKIVVDPAGTPADAHVFTQVAHTDVGSSANHNSGQFALYTGPQAATDYRYEVTAVSGGTWNVQVAAVVIDEI